VSVPEASASTTFFQLLGNQDRVLDSILKGSEVLSWEIHGQEAGAAPFRLAVQDRYVSDFDIAFESSWEIADFVFALSRIKGVTIDDVTMISDVSDDRSTWEVTRVEQLRAGSWVPLNRRHPAFATAGKVLKLRAVLTSGTDTRNAPVSLAIPAKASGAQGLMTVMGGSNLFSEDSFPGTVAQAKRYVDNLVRNDEVVAQLEAFTERSEIVKTAQSAAQDKVISGHRRVPVLIR
jgi:hypothetical protein